MIFCPIVYMTIKRALLIGINYLNTEHQLDGCIDDIINARNMLIDAYDYEKRNIIMLRDDTEDSSFLPNYENIMKQLDIIVTNSHECSEIWIQYSGHGAQLNDDLHIGTFKTPTSSAVISEQDDGVKELSDVIVPLDIQNQQYITDVDIHNFIKKINKSCVAIFVFDCCHSGSLGKLPWTTIVNENKEFVIINNKEIDKDLILNPNIFFLSGCKDAQTSSDVYSRELAENVGAFSNAFNECLRDGRHHIDILTLYKNISACLAIAGYSQTPVLSSTISKPTYMFQKRP